MFGAKGVGENEGERHQKSVEGTNVGGVAEPQRECRESPREGGAKQHVPFFGGELLDPLLPRDLAVHNVSEALRFFN